MVGLNRGLRANDTIEGAIARARLYFVPFLVFSIVVNMMTLMLPIYMLQIYDRVLTSRNVTTLVLITLVALSMVAVGALISHYRAVAAARLGAHLHQELSDFAFGGMVKRRLDSKVSKRLVSDLERIHDFVAGGSLNRLFDAPWTPIFLLVLFLLHPAAGLVATSFSIAMLLLGCLSIWRTDDRAKACREIKGDADQFLKTSLGSSDTIWSMGMAKAIVGNWRRRRTEAAAEQASVDDLRSGYKSTRRFLQQAGQMSMIGTGAYLAIHGQITPGAIVAGSVICARALQPIDGTIRSWHEALKVRRAYAAIQELSHLDADKSKTRIHDAPSAGFQVRKLTTVPGDSGEPVVRDLDVALDTGESLSIVWPAGFGRSLLAQTLVGFRKPALGVVTFNGIDLHRIAPDRTNMLFGYASQRLALFDGTVGQNIARFRDGTSGDLDQAANRVGLRDILSSLPHGYETPIIEAMEHLSSTHLRFITLARALYQDPALLVIDQIDSDLAPRWIGILEDVVQTSRSLGQTLIWITNTTSLVHEMDHILNLSEVGAGDMLQHGRQSQGLLVD